MVHKLKVAKEFDDRELDNAVKVVLEEGAEVLHKLARV
jgi:hypothetical protein